MISGTTAPPSAAVAHHGNWSLGPIFDIYWLFAEAGDHYCGRILAGLDSLSSSFDVLPPHFIVGLENEKVKQALEVNFKFIFKLGEKDGYKNIHSLLLRCFASLIYHSNSLIEMSSKIPGHPFLSIPILQDAELLADLKKLVTIEPSPVIPCPTGIPPHSAMLKEVHAIKEIVEESRDEMIKFSETIANVVAEKIEQHALSQGHLTYDNVTKILQTQAAEFSAKLKEQAEIQEERHNEMMAAIGGNNANQNKNASDTFVQNLKNVSSTTYSYYHNGKFHHVPINFALPTKVCFLRQAWILWLNGMPNFRNEDGTPAPVMPFRKMDVKCLPNKIATRFRVDWVPVLSKMEEAPDLPAEVKNTSLANFVPFSTKIIDTSFERALSFLKTQYSYIFTKPKYKKNKDWKVSNWCKMIKRSVVEKEGSEADKSFLCEATFRNGKRRRTR